jgi:hypothetical protein
MLVALLKISHPKYTSKYQVQYELRQIAVFAFILIDIYAQLGDLQENWAVQWFSANLAHHHGTVRFYGR